MVEITFRMAKVADAKMLLSWRNDKDSRENSIHRGIVTKEEHAAWIESIIGSTENILLIAEMDGVAVGSFRMDKVVVEDVGDSPDIRLISYVVAPALRKKGIGRAIVEEGCVCYGQEYNLIAKIRDSNVASKKILESCDFRLWGEVEKGIVAYLRPNDREDTIQ